MGMTQNMRIVISCAIVAGAYLVDFLCCRFLIPVIRKIAVKTSFKWDNYITNGKVLHNIFHLIPPIAFQFAFPMLFHEQNQWTVLTAKFLNIYTIIIFCRLICEFITSLYAISNESETLKDKPMKGVYQLLKVVIVCISVILIIGVLINKDFTALLAGLGAMATVLMLVFKDTILGVVAGVQLSAHDMLRPGDWIVLEKYDVNGIVEDVTMNTVKVRNWDKTITTIPPYILVSDSFKNWRGMRESGGRRVARAINIDMNSIRFCTREELDRFASEDWARDMHFDENTVNLKVFRTATEHYLRSQAEINTDLMLLVRQLDPTPEGLPLQFYFFTLAQDWVPHENIASDVMEHLIASLPKFGLKVFQRPSGLDLSSYLTSTGRNS